MNLSDDWMDFDENSDIPPEWEGCMRLRIYRGTVGLRMRSEAGLRRYPGSGSPRKSHGSGSARIPNPALGR
jgi:hypothetical protein